MEVAQEWRLTPMQFYEETALSRAYMMAYTLSNRKMKAYENQQEERRAKAAQAKSKSKGRS